ncbi:ketosynthase chain-length factor [Micromonospora sp. NPDC049204]|uniref:ketosynthase chain-length factor n=1 Tax=Micromonospora sp. NPDC049204 TaxID=3154351 RepID=UPI0033EB034A
MTTRTVVTGLGIASPTGVGVDPYWQATLRGRTAIVPITRFDATGYPATLAGEITGFAPEQELPDRLLPQTDRMTRLALVSADRALADAALTPADLGPYDVGVITASHSGGFEFGERELRALWSQGGQFVSAYQSFAWFYAVNSGQISIRNELRGPSAVVVSDQAGGLDALAHARRQVRKGTPVVVAGAVDASLCSWGWVAQLAGGRLSNSRDPQHAYLPFDPRAAGHVPGEGGALLIVEDADHARRRQAPHVYGEIAGHAATTDPAPGTGRPSGLVRAVTLALAEAGADPTDIDVVFADAAAVPELDQVEAAAISTVFGPRGVPVTAPKTMTGRLYSGAAPLDVAAALLSIRDGVIPPTVNSDPAPEYELDLVTGAPRPARVRTALVLARGHGGFNSALVVRAPQPVLVSTSRPS